MIINFSIPNCGELRLEIENEIVQRFSMCQFQYENKDCKIDIYRDFLYVFVENMLGRIKKIPTLKQPELFGKLGKWQEYFYYDYSTINLCVNEINQMKGAIFVSTENYGSFIYRFNDKIWLELNRGYVESSGMKPHEYYENHTNYQILMASIPSNTLCEWKEKLEHINKMMFT